MDKSPLQYPIPDKNYEKMFKSPLQHMISDKNCEKNIKPPLQHQISIKKSEKNPVTNIFIFLSLFIFNCYLYVLYFYR